MFKRIATFTKFTQKAFHLFSTIKNPYGNFVLKKILLVLNPMPRLKKSKNHIVSLLKNITLIKIQILQPKRYLLKRNSRCCFIKSL